MRSETVQPSWPPAAFGPAGAFVLLRTPRRIGIVGAALVWAALSRAPEWLPIGQAATVSMLAAALLAILAWNLLVRQAERYRLTEAAAIAESGVLRRLRVEVPLARVQNTVLYRSPGERLFGLGTIGVATAGTDGYELVWRSIPAPQSVLDALNAAVNAAAGPASVVERSRSSLESVPATHRPSASREIPVIGIAGGIGSGKSTVARMFGERGCLVIDSDQRAREALDRPEVRQTLVGWWGADILTPEGRVDRSRVARIVFADPEQRARLEGLVHPIVRRDRAGLISEALAAGRRVPAVVIDAPLLFEAGLDAECDHIVFVDAPREVRLDRVRRSRSWDAAELSRREAAQWPLDRKKAAASHVLQNASDDPAAEARLRIAVGELLDRICGSSPPDRTAAR